MKYSYKFIFQGIEKDEAAPSQDCLTEFLNDTVIIRSLRCKFTLKDEHCDNSDIELKSACDECAKILTSHSTYDQTNLKKNQNKLGPKTTTS